MKNTSFLKRLSAVNPEQIRGYLVHNGWIEDGGIGNIATIWHRPLQDNSDFEILSPENKNIRDYSSRVKDLVEVLSDYEDREIEGILSDISEFFADLIKVRVAHDDVEGGTIPLKDGVLLIEKAREIIVSATLATLSKRRYFSGSHPQEVSDFIGNARLGQTEVGSYVVNVITPISIPEKELIERSSFSRLVTTTLAKSLSAIHGIVDNNDPESNLGSIDQTVEQGVSANLCDALIGLAGDQKSRDFSISISFSKLEPIDPSIQQMFAFKSSSVRNLERVSEYLKDNYVIKNKRIFGIVTKLDRDANEAIGKVTITAHVEDRERNVTFELPNEDYLEAIRAHENKWVVECFGDIHVNSRSAKLINNREFRVIQKGNLFEP